MESVALDKFDTVINLIVEDEAKRKDIRKAAIRLLEDSAMDMSEQVTTALGMILLKIYENGHVPGKTENPAINKLAAILADAGRRDASNQTTHDSY
jgi:hypothetical protein